MDAQWRRTGVMRLVQTSCVTLNANGLLWARHIIHDPGGMVVKNFSLLVSHGWRRCDDGDLRHAVGARPVRHASWSQQGVVRAHVRRHGDRAERVRAARPSVLHCLCGLHCLEARVSPRSRRRRHQRGPARICSATDRGRSGDPRHRRADHGPRARTCAVGRLVAFTRARVSRSRRARGTDGVLAPPSRHPAVPHDGRRSAFARGPTADLCGPVAGVPATASGRRDARTDGAVLRAPFQPR